MAENQPVAPVRRLNDTSALVRRGIRPGVAYTPNEGPSAEAAVTTLRPSGRLGRTGVPDRGDTLGCAAAYLRGEGA